MRVAVLDRAGYLVGSKQVKKPKDADVDCGDLPTDGSYRLVDGVFIPKGFGKGKPSRAPVDRDRAIYDALTALIDGNPIPQTTRKWCAWYKGTFL